MTDPHGPGKNEDAAQQPGAPFPGTGPHGPGEPPQAYGWPYGLQEPKRKRRVGVWGILATILLVFSALGNAVFLVIIVALAAAGSADRDVLLEHVIQPGPRSAKIAVIRLEGVIDDSLVKSLQAKIHRASTDSNVRAVILRINSPGGGLTASDVLHHEVKTLLADRGKPVIAAMDSVAASGGYYVACASDRIVAQPTTITGSIGVIAQFFFLNTLMKDKLGIVPVTLKMGERKDWPNIFGATELTEEQHRYLMETLLVPGYEQFVDVVAEGREMDRQEVLKLATGRVFMAREAREANLIDEVGYFNRAVELAKEAAGIDEARVVEYREPFRVRDLLGLSAKAEAALEFGPEKLAALASPRVMYLWTGF